MDLKNYRNSEREKFRIADLMNLLPSSTKSALDVGARDGYVSNQLANRSIAVTALDLEAPSIDQQQIRCVQGNVTALHFADNIFDLVLCSEVLEHIPPDLLSTACNELVRVAKEYILIGVPYRQDTRVASTTCYTCGKVNPPWGHVNRFDEHRLVALFSGCEVAKISMVGQAEAGTNHIAYLLMKLAGNPYGTYEQDEPCIHCGAKLEPPPERSLWQKILTRAAFVTTAAQKPFSRSHANWIHILFRKTPLRKASSEMTALSMQGQLAAL